MDTNFRNTDKNARYTFRVGSEIKDKFRMYCKVMNVSPSDVLTEVMVEFNNNAEQIIQMRDIAELQEMFRQKVLKGQMEIDSLKAMKK